MAIGSVSNAANTETRALWRTALISILVSLPLAVVFLFYTLPHVERRILDSKKDSTRIAVESVYKILEYYDHKIQAKELSLADGQAQALAVIKDLRYSGSEYFWINDLHPVMLMHPFKPDLVGKDLTGIADPNGKHLFIEMKEVGERLGEGFVDYLWPKPGSELPVGKIGFVKLYKPWGWLVGSGVYTDDVQLAIGQVRRNNLILFGLATLAALAMSFFAGFRQLRNVILPIKNVIGTLEAEAEQLDQTSARLGEASGNLKSVGIRQSAAIQETASAMVEINEMITVTSENAVSSTKATVETRDLATEGQRKMQDLITAIEAIRESGTRVTGAVEQSNENLNALIRMMHEISSKTQVINDIVFQTRLLSFNASVEAARAGEQGRGFAVVAEEIGNLARLSGASAQEINSIIQGSEEKAKTLLEESRRNVSRILQENQTTLNVGRDLSTACVEVLERVVARSEHSNQLSEAISISNREQASGSAEVSRAMVELENVNHKSQSLYEATAEASQLMSERVHVLHGLVRDLVGIVDQTKRSEIPSLTENVQSGRASTRRAA